MIIIRESPNTVLSGIQQAVEERLNTIQLVWDPTFSISYKPCCVQ